MITANSLIFRIVANSRGRDWRNRAKVAALRGCALVLVTYICIMRADNGHSDAVSKVSERKELMTRLRAVALSLFAIGLL
ncbi:MAG: hypothetical protein MJE12_17265, partial [Alphaproteobacteria bacterium]|nr:hypothetical protein [Alphaproteobacteria bacterium]